MTLPKFIKRGNNDQTEAKKEAKKMVPQGVKHVDLLRTMHLDTEAAPNDTNPQSHKDTSDVHSGSSEETQGARDTKCKCSKGSCCK